MKTLLAAIALLFSANIYAGPPSGLIAYYPFEGNANDQSGNSNNATPTGNYSFVGGGVTGEALRLTGDNALFYSGGGYLNLPQFGSSLNSGFTVSLWVKDVTVGSDPVGEEDFISFGILDQPEAGIAINNDSGNGAFLEYYVDTGSGGPAHLDAVTIDDPIPNLSSFEDSWQNLVMVYAPGELNAYLDGNPIADVSDPALLFDGFPVTEAALGSHWWDGGANHSARMSATYDNVAIYDTALTAVQVQAEFTDRGQVSVPEGGATSAMVGAALVGMAMLCRKFTTLEPPSKKPPGIIKSGVFLIGSQVGGAWSQDWQKIWKYANDRGSRLMRPGTVGRGRYPCICS